MPRRLALYAAAAMVLTVACVVEVAEQERPPSVATTAEWVGGADGGVWVDLRESGEPGSYDATISAQATGVALYDGTLVLDQLTAEDDLASLKRSLNAWDGESLLLKDGRELRQTKE